MLAQRADEVLGQGVAFVDISADFAHIAFFALGLGLRLDVLLIVGVGSGLLVRYDTCLGDFADEHSVGVKVHVLLHLERKEGVDVSGQENQSVI